MKNNSLYQDTYPDILSAFGAYFRNRVEQDEFPLFSSYKGTPRSLSGFLETARSNELIRSKGISSYFEDGLKRSLAVAFKEFLFLAFPQLDQLRGITKRDQMQSLNELTKKYKDFFGDSYFKKLFTSAKSYIESGHSKMPNARFDMKADDEVEFPHAQTYERIQAGLQTGSELTVWGNLLKHGMEDEFSVKKFLRATASVDIDHVGKVIEGTGYVKGQDMSSQKRVYDLVDPTFETGLRSGVVNLHQTENTLKCPARNQPSPKMKQIIESSFPNQKAISLIGILEEVVSPAMQSSILELKEKYPTRDEIAKFGIPQDEITLLYDNVIPGRELPALGETLR